MYSPSRLSSAVDGQLLAKRRRTAYGGTVGPGGSPVGLRMQPRNEKFFTRFSKAGSNVVESAAILMEFVAAPHERWAELARRLHDTEHAGDDTISVGEPDEGGGQDGTAAIDDGVLVVPSRKAAPMLEAVEGTFDDVAAAVGVLVVADRAAAAGAAATAMGFLVIGRPADLARRGAIRGRSLPAAVPAPGAGPAAPRHGR
jgi:hypothetical protein